jgi:hypothetical protein
MLSSHYQVKFDKIAEELERRGSSELAAEVDQFASAVLADTMVEARAPYDNEVRSLLREIGLAQQNIARQISDSPRMSDKAMELLNRTDKIVAQLQKCHKKRNCTSQHVVAANAVKSELGKMVKHFRTQQDRRSQQGTKQQQDFFEEGVRYTGIKLKQGLLYALVAILGSAALFYLFYKTIKKFGPKIKGWFEGLRGKLSASGHRPGQKPNRQQQLIIKEEIEQLDNRQLDELKRTTEMAGGRAASWLGEKTAEVNPTLDGLLDATDGDIDSFIEATYILNKVTASFDSEEGTQSPFELTADWQDKLKEEWDKLAPEHKTTVVVALVLALVALVPQLPRLIEAVGYLINSLTRASSKIYRSIADWFKKVFAKKDKKPTTAEKKELVQLIRTLNDKEQFVLFSKISKVAIKYGAMPHQNIERMLKKRAI